jgi:hypothetical protein
MSIVAITICIAHNVICLNDMWLKNKGKFKLKIDKAAKFFYRVDCVFLAKISGSF